jgi:hypothetical protein
VRDEQQHQRGRDQPERAGPHQRAAHGDAAASDAGLRTQVGQCEHEEANRQHRLSVLMLGRDDPLTGQPGRGQQSGQERLRPLVEETPGDPGTQRPEQEPSGPMFFQMEDLPGEKDGATQRGGAAGVQRGGYPARVLGHDGGCQVERPHRADDEREALPRSQRIPVGGDEQQDTGGDHQPA